MLTTEACAVLVIDLQEKLVPALTDQVAIVGRCRLVLEAARRLAVPALLTEQYPRGLGPTVPAIASLVAPSAVAKTTFSALREAEAAARIESLGRERLVVMGAEAHVCVLQTVMDLLCRKRPVAVVADAIGSRQPSDLEAGLDRMRRAGADIVTAEMVVFEWLERAGTADFKALAPLLRNRGSADVDA